MPRTQTVTYGLPDLWHLQGQRDNRDQRQEEVDIRDEKTAFVFPGQGSQTVGMGRDLYDTSSVARSVFEEADEALGFGLTRLCFDGPDDTLRQTVNAQPAILAVSIAYLRTSPTIADTSPDYVAGHSLGEYTALVASGVLSFKDAVYLARERGRLMQQAGEQSPGGMLAILGLDESAVDEVCQRSGTQIANLNCPGQIAISGTLEGLNRALQLAKSMGAQRVVPLQVSGAFHSPLMQAAVEGMREVVSRLEFHDAAVPIVANTTAQPIMKADDIRAELLNQLCHCVRWQRSVEFMIDQGVRTFIEVGPGQVLTGLIKRISKDTQIVTLNGKRG